MARGVYVVIVT